MFRTNLSSAKLDLKKYSDRTLIIIFYLSRQNHVTSIPVNRTRGMAPYSAPPKKGASSYVSRYAAIRDTIGLPHIDLIGSTSQIHLPNARTER